MHGDSAHLAAAFYSHYHHLVPNSDSSKKDLDEIIGDIWAKKSVNDAAKGSRSMLSDFFNDYLKNKYGMQVMVAKWAYSIMHALRQNIWDYAVEMFLLILSGDVSEDAYHDANAMVEHFKKFCQRISDAEVSNTKVGVVKKVSAWIIFLSLAPSLYCHQSWIRALTFDHADQSPSITREVFPHQEQGRN